MQYIKLSYMCGVMQGLFFAGVVGVCAAFWLLFVPPGIGALWVAGGAVVSWLLLMAMATNKTP
jgi:hypothetical protein